MVDVGFNCKVLFRKLGLCLALCYSSGKKLIPGKLWSQFWPCDIPRILGNRPSHIERDEVGEQGG